MTTNLTPAELDRRLGAATASRLVRLCADVPLTPSSDYRALQAEREASMA